QVVDAAWDASSARSNQVIDGSPRTGTKSRAPPLVGSGFRAMTAPEANAPTVPDTANGGASGVHMLGVRIWLALRASMHTPASLLPRAPPPLWSLKPAPEAAEAPLGQSASTLQAAQAPPVQRPLLQSPGTVQATPAAPLPPLRRMPLQTVFRRVPSGS